MQKIIEWMSKNHVAANLLMFLIIFGGIIALSLINKEVFPEIELDIVQIQVVYPGASPDEVEESICIKIEETLEGISEIKKIRSIANEGIAVITAELEKGEDVFNVKDKIKGEIDRIESFPEFIEEPVIKELKNRMQVLQIAVYGNADERTIKRIAQKMKDDLAQTEKISQVLIDGIRNDEISIELSEINLRNYGLSFEQVTRAVRMGSLDLPGGSVETENGEILIRTKGLGYNKTDYENIILRSRPNGQILRIKHVGNVIDGFEDADLISTFDGKPAAMLSVFRVGEQDAPEVAETAREYVENLRPELPAGLSLAIWNDTSILLKERIELLSKNALLGLILVLICLTLFLELRLALWVALGIVISFLGTFVVMLLLDVSINMMTLFAFILVLGIVVDDAIVVGENVFTSQQNGLSPQDAASKGTFRVTKPVIFAVATSIVAFVPIMFVVGIMGKFMIVIPIVVISALSFSLIESLFILPAHLSNININSRFKFLNKLDDLRGYISKHLQKFIHGFYTRTLNKALKNRKLTLAISFVVFMLSIGLLSSGILSFNFMPRVDADTMYVQFSLPQGTTAEQTMEVVKRIEHAAKKVEADNNLNKDENESSIFKHIYSTIGENPTKDNAMHGGTGKGIARSEIAEIKIEMVSAKEREVSSSDLAQQWREKVGQITGIESITYSSNLMSMGNDIEVELSATDSKILAAGIEELKHILVSYNGVNEIRDDFESGKKEIKLQLKPAAATLGLTLQDLARQVRQAYYGDEAFRIQRGKDEVKVMVRYPKEDRNSLADIEKMRIRTPQGNEIPFKSVAALDYGRGFSQIKRVDGRRVIAVIASVDAQKANANQINSEIKEEILPKLMTKYPGLSFAYEGIQKQRQDSIASLGLGYIIALFVMYGLLAIPFKSYAQPLVIMSAVPFGIVGAIWGHLLLGYTMSMISLFGVVALSGVVINDSLILIDYVNGYRGDNMSLQETIVQACIHRFRPILLTSLTTFFGLMPMILETSFQARFLIPMAISLGFGVLTGTAIILIMIPASVLVLEDMRVYVNSLFRRIFITESKAEVV